MKVPAICSPDDSHERRKFSQWLNPVLGCSDWKLQCDSLKLMKGYSQLRLIEV
jgi:hypothetical protein